MNIKYFIVESYRKIDDDWYKLQKSFYTVEEMNEYIVNNTCSRFTIIVAREVTNK